MNRKTLICLLIIFSAFVFCLQLGTDFAAQVPAPDIGGGSTSTCEHEWEWKTDTAATCTTAGKKHEECKKCHTKRKENTTIDALRT